jgi:hypothetical protein
MAEPILDKASYSLVRTNPKLTGNVKLLTNGINLYLESFSANNELSSSKFKSFKIDGSLTYDQDVFSFFKKGTLPSELAYEVFQEFKDTSVLSSYENQYEMFYSAGARSLASEVYTEDIGMLAPLWLNEQIPNYFVVFRLDNPASINNSKAEFSNEGETLAQSSKNFTEFVLQNCTAIKTFDLRETSKIGSYIRRYRNQENFPKSPLTVSWKKDEPIQWNGISYHKGGFTSAGNFSYDSLIAKDSTILQNEYFFTKGFQRNGILLANLINLEFLFSDETAKEYSINRYFGLYVNEVVEGEFKLSGENFYNDHEKTQFPVIKTINEVSELLNSKLEISNSNGVLLHIDSNSITTQTGLPTPPRVNSVESIFYVKDKSEQFHTVKKGSFWKNNQVRLFDTQIDVSQLAGFNKPISFVNAQVIRSLGKPSAFLNIIGEFPDGVPIKFYSGEVDENTGSIEQNVIGQVSANVELTNGPGTNFERFFNPNGTPQEIAKAIVRAIKHGIKEDHQLFNVSINDSYVYLESKFSGLNAKQLKFELDWIEYPELIKSVETYPKTGVTNTVGDFVGGTNKPNSLLLVEKGEEERLIKGSYVKTKAGFAKTSDWAPYLKEPIIAGSGLQIGYRNIDNYVIVSVDDNQIEISNSGQLAVYTDFLPSFGRFSFFPIKDLDFDFYSEMYSNLGELKYERLYYDKAVGSTSSVSNWSDIKTFYKETGFSNLIGLLKDADPDETFDIDIASEYQRLEENFLKEQAIASRISPYINKWAWRNNGTDVRNNPYRLNLSLGFGINNFAPSKWNTGRSPIGFSHEWYYLSQFPSYFSDEAIKNSWSYFSNVPVDNVLENSFIPGTFQRVDKNMFNEYFIADRFNVNNNIHLIDRQLRFGRFSGGNKQNYAETFLRGVRVIAKAKANGEEKPNFNAKKLSYIYDGSFNDYSFSVMLVPNAPGKPNRQIKFIKNDKWKTIVMLIFVSFKNDCLNPTEFGIDRTSLYAMNSSIETSAECDPNAGYKNSIMQGAINFLASSWLDDIDQWLIQGTPDINGNPTSFLTDVTIGESGEFNQIKFSIGDDVYEIKGITRVVSSDQLYASSITKNNNPFVVPSPIPSPFELQTTTYENIGGGFNGYTFTLDRVSFADIFNAVNDGDPTIIYETINTDGSRALNSNNSLAQTFSIELRVQEDILKSNYIGVLPDLNKPTIFNLLNVIGYDLSIQAKPRINPIARHAGYYEPLSKDIVFFRDPYANIDFTGDSYMDYTESNSEHTGITGMNTVDEIYKFKVFNLCRYKNTQFYSDHENFGLIKNYFYHKVNQEDSSSILELSTNSAFLSLYPLINEVGINYKDHYIFSSNWEPGYFIKSIDKSKIQSVIGTQSMKEKKSFFGSKYLKVPQEIKLETFTSSDFIKNAIAEPSLVNGTFMHNETPEYVEFYLLVQKRLIDHLFKFIKPVFQQYISPKFGTGSVNNVDDDVINYIEKNILSLYKISTIDFYVKENKEKKETDYTTAELNNREKLAKGLILNRNVSTKTLNINLFDTKLIYNKRTGFSNSYGFSVTIVKK